MPRKKIRLWQGIIFIAQLILGIGWLAYGVSVSKAFDFTMAACLLGLNLGWTYLLFRDRKNLPENPLDGSDWSSLP